MLHALSAHDRGQLVGSSFFPNLISGPSRDGLHAAFTFAIVACLVAAAASLMRGQPNQAQDSLRVRRPQFRDGADPAVLED